MANAHLIIQNSHEGILTHPEIFDPSTGLRALFIDREDIFALPSSWTENSCGFYILLSNIQEEQAYDAFVGKVIKGFSGMLKEHDETKSFWKTAILIKLDKGINPGMSINQAAYMEGRIREILEVDESVNLRNIRPPWDHVPSNDELKEVLPIIDFTLQVLAVRGYLRHSMVNKAKSVSKAIRHSYKIAGGGMVPLFRIPMPPQRPVFISPVSRISSMGKKSVELNPELTQEDLFSALKSWRTKKALSESVPAYVITNNRTLEDIASMKPATKADLLKIQGMGKKRVELYGDEILSIINSKNSLVA